MVDYRATSKLLKLANEQQLLFAGGQPALSGSFNADKKASVLSISADPKYDAQ